jgi:hypothetical protein
MVGMRLWRAFAQKVDALVNYGVGHEIVKENADFLQEP